MTPKHVLLGSIIALMSLFSLSSIDVFGDSFTSPQNISNNSEVSAIPSIATDGTNILVTWAHSDTPSNSDIFFSKSTDGGITWSTPQNISNTGIVSSRPSIATDGTNILVTWAHSDTPSGNFEILFSKSTDGGITWSTPQNISNTGGGSEFSSIATDGTNILVTWRHAASGNVEILFSKSTDGGITWSTPQNISNNSEVSSHPSIATDGTNILVTWDDNLLGNQNIFFSKSTDGGITWSTPQNISNTGIVSSHPSIATDGTNILVTWAHSDTPSNSDIFFSKSTDGGITWSTP
nr:glycoside hydrolase [archaeon]